MLLYHGSSTKNIQKLEPRLADHNRPYIYLTTNQIVAAIYIVNVVERPYYWFPYGFDKSGRVEYHELYPNALKEVYEGMSGNIYIVDVPEEEVLPFKNISSVKLGTKPIKVMDCIVIDDCYKWLIEQEKLGNFSLKRYEDKSSEELNNWYDMILRDITENNMIKTPNCSYLEFIKLKFPSVWNNYKKRLRYSLKGKVVQGE